MIKKKILIFDAYGTIFNTKNDSVKATEKILKRNDSQLDAGYFYKCWKEANKEIIVRQKSYLSVSQVFRIGLRLLYEQFGIQGNAEEDVFIMLEILGRREAFPEVNIVFRELRKFFWILIGSNSDSKPLHDDIERNGIVVDGIYSSESLRAYKPNKIYYHSIMNHFPDYIENEFVFIGDSEIDDVQIPLEIGMNAIWVNRKNSRLQNDINPYRIVSSLDELLDFSLLKELVR